MNFRDFKMIKEVNKMPTLCALVALTSSPAYTACVTRSPLNNLAQLKSIKKNDTNTYRELLCAVIFHFTVGSASIRTNLVSLLYLTVAPIISFIVIFHSPVLFECVIKEIYFLYFMLM